MSKVRKSITRDKSVNLSFYLIFFDANTNFKTLQTCKNLKHTPKLKTKRLSHFHKN
jgi:hypothetical protein